MHKTIRIGTRGSELALWQANTVKAQLEALGYKTTLTIVKATGDLMHNAPLYELGITGIFTKTLDTAMLEGTIDIAVHSMKDVPTLLPKGIVKAAVLKRAAVEDLVICKETLDFSDKNRPFTIATGSLRRKAQWLHRYPHHNLVNLRGSVNTRLQKLKDNLWEGAIFAKAGLERIDSMPEKYHVLDWMIPAPAQGAMLVVAMEKDTFSREALQALHDTTSDLCTHIEREFLRELEGGCTAPIGALATVEAHNVHFKGAIHSLDGAKEITIEKTIALKDATHFGKHCAREVLNNGGDKLMQHIREHLIS